MMADRDDNSAAAEPSPRAIEVAARELAALIDPVRGEVPVSTLPPGHLQLLLTDPDDRDFYHLLGLPESLQEIVRQALQEVTRKTEQEGIALPDEVWIWLAILPGRRCCWELLVRNRSNGSGATNPTQSNRIPSHRSRSAADLAGCDRPADLADFERRLYRRLEQMPVLPLPQCLAFAWRWDGTGGDSSVTEWIEPFPQLRATLGELRWQVAVERSLRSAPQRLQPVDAAELSAWIRCAPQSADLRCVQAGLLVQQQRCDAALRIYDQLVDQYPERLRYRMGRAECLVGLEQWDDALIELQGVLARRPSYLPAQRLLGRLAHLRGRLDEALQQLTALLSQRPALIPCLIDRAVVLMDAGEFDLAEADLNRTIEIRPDYSQAWLLRAWLRTQRSRVQQAGQTSTQGISADLELARADIDRYVQLCGGSHESREQRAALLFDLRLWTATIDELNWLLTQSGAEPTLRLLRGRCFALLHKLELAIEDYTQVIAEVEQLPGSDSLLAEALLLRATSQCELNRYEEALPDCERAAELGQDASILWLVRGVIAVSQYDWTAALDAFQAAVERDPESGSARLWRAKVLAELGRFEAAEQDLKLLQQLLPGWWEGWYTHGLILQGQGQFDAAREQFDAALRCRPGHPTVLLARAELMLQRGELEQAIADCNQALLQGDERPELFWLRAQALMQRGRPDEAISDLELVMSLDQSAVGAKLLTAQIRLKQGRFAAALQLVEQILETQDDLVAAWLLRGELRSRKYGPGEGDADFQQAIALAPEQAAEIRSHQLMVDAQLQFAADDYQGVIDSTSEVLELQPGSRPARRLRAACYWYSGQLVEAIDDLNQVLVHHPDDAGATSSRGQIYCELGEFPAALTDLNRAVTLLEPLADPTSLAYALSGRALALAGLKRWDEAERNVDDSISLHSENAWVFFNLGVIYHQQQQVSRAARCFELALALTQPALPVRKQKQARGFLMRIPDQQPDPAQT